MAEALIGPGDEAPRLDVHDMLLLKAHRNKHISRLHKRASAYLAGAVIREDHGAVAGEVPNANH